MALSRSLCIAIAVEFVLLGTLWWLAGRQGRSGDGQAGMAYLCPMALFVLFGALIGFGALVAWRRHDREFRRGEHALAAWIGVAITGLATAIVVILYIRE